MLFAGNLSDKYGKKLLDVATETGIDAEKADSKKVVHNPAEATGELIGNKIAEIIVKPKPVVDKYSRNIKEINKRKEKKYQTKWSTIKYQKIKRFNCINVCDKKIDHSE